MLFSKKTLFCASVVILGLTALSASAQVTEIGGYRLIVALPGVAGGGSPQSLAEYIRFIYLWLMAVVALAAGIVLLFGGVRYVLSAGNPGKAQDARDQISHALLGLVVVLASYLILNTINPSLVHFSSSELGDLNLPISRTRTGGDVLPAVGECLSTDSPLGLGGTDCSVIGNGWSNNSDGCNDSCAAGSEVCCVCNAGDSCAPKEHTCARVDDETEAILAFQGPEELCDVYLRQDCSVGCPSGTDLKCVEGNWCSGPAPEDLTFEIIAPAPPSGGATVVSMEPNAPVSITIRAPAGIVATVRIRVYSPSGALVFTGVCAIEQIGICGNVWIGGTTEPGNYRIEAEGEDPSGNLVAKMEHKRLVCGSCGPIATFTFETECRGATPYLLLNGSGSSSPLGAELNLFEWMKIDPATQIPDYIYQGVQPAPRAEAPMIPTLPPDPPYTILLRVTDKNGATGTTNQLISIPPC